MKVLQVFHEEGNNGDGFLGVVWCSVGGWVYFLSVTDVKRAPRRSRIQSFLRTLLCLGGSAEWIRETGSEDCWKIKCCSYFVLFCSPLTFN